MGNHLVTAPVLRVTVLGWEPTVLKTDTIYLNEQLLEGDFEDALNVLTEEVGHALDAQLNSTDAAGDEGAIFATLLSGESIDAAQLNELKTENDTGSIIVDGKETEVEFSWLSKQLGRTGRQIDDNIIQPIKNEAERFGSRIDDNIFQPVKDAGKIVLRGSKALLELAIVRPFQETWKLSRGNSSAVKQFFNGDFKEAWSTFSDTTINAVTSVVRLPLEGVRNLLAYRCRCMGYLAWRSGRAQT